jgi:putative iron-regulated protein
MKNFTPFNILAICLGALFFIRCGEDSPITQTGDYSEVLADVANNVIVQTYTNLDNRAQALLTAVNNLKNNRTITNLSAAREAWVATREPWELSEGFLFGPVDTEGIDPSIDSWPVNQVDLESVLASSSNLTAAFVQNLEGTLRGFHTIEFLLWGGNGQKTIGAFSEREFDYLVAATQVLADDVNKLANAWQANGGNFVSNITNAGKSGSIYISQKAALEELANGILLIADEVGNGKINDPLEQEDYTLEESRFSNNSKADFSDNIKSVQNVYKGINGSGLTDIVAAKNASLDAQIKADIQAAIDAIQAIPGNFTEAIPANSPTRTAAENAQTKVRTLQATLEGKLTPLISNL